MRYIVELSAHGNIDHGEDPYKPLENVYQGTKESDTIEELQQIVRDYIDKYDLGGGQWTGGKVTEDGKEIGRISYNSRYWPLEQLKEKGWA